MKHAQKGRMEEQRCSLPISTPATPTHNGSALNNIPTGAETDAFFKAIATSQSRRLDDQRASLPVLPGISGASTEKLNFTNKEDESANTAPQITVTQSTPTTSRKEFTRPVSDPHWEHSEPVPERSIPKSASFGPEASPSQVTVKVSLSFTSLQGLMKADQPGTFPELFLTLGAPGDNLVIPLSPMPGRRLSLSLNLVPKDDTDSTQMFSNHPREAYSRPSSPKVTCHNFTSSPQHQEISVSHSKGNLTQTAKDQKSQDKKGGQKIKGKGNDKPVQDKGKKVVKKR